MSFTEPRWPQERPGPSEPFRTRPLGPGVRERRDTEAATGNSVADVAGGLHSPRSQRAMAGERHVLRWKVVDPQGGSVSLSVK